MEVKTKIGDAFSLMGTLCVQHFELEEHNSTRSRFHSIYVVFLDESHYSNFIDYSFHHLDGDPLFGGYEGYVSGPFQVLGIICFCFAAFVFLVRVGFPNLYSPLAKPQNEDVAAELEKYRECYLLSKKHALDETPSDSKLASKKEVAEASSVIPERQNLTPQIL